MKKQNDEQRRTLMAQRQFELVGRQRQAEPKRARRQRPRAMGGGDFYHILLRPKEDFVSFRTQDVGQPGHVERVAGKTVDGRWSTVKWLVGKKDAHIENDKLVPDTEDARQLFRQLGSQPVHIGGDLFEARPRANAPELDKPTSARRRARRGNVKKIQAARKTRSDKKRTRSV